jgi:hypothetical protein
MSARGSGRGERGRVAAGQSAPRRALLVLLLLLILTGIRPAARPRKRDAENGVDAEERARVLQVREHPVEQVDDVARDAEEVVGTEAVAARGIPSLVAVLNHCLPSRRIEELVVQGKVLLRAARVELHAVELCRVVLRHVALVVDEPLDGLAARAAVEIPMNIALVCEEKQGGLMRRIQSGYFR